MNGNDAGRRIDFLLVGSGRSGTSLLAGLLDHHSAIEVGFESFADDYLRGQALPERRETLFHDRAGGFVARSREAAQRSPKPLWGNKITTEQLAGLNKHNLYNQPPVAVLPTFFDRYLAGVKVIHILRDGRACVQSKLRRSPQLSLERACHSWKYAAEVYDFLQRRANTCSVRFEALVSAPEAELRRIFDFLGVGFEAAALGGTMNEKMLPVYQRATVEASRADDIDYDHPCAALIADELQRCGYR